MCQALFFDPWIRKIPWRRAWQLIPVVVILAWRIPWTEEPGSAMHRVGRDWSDSACMHASTILSYHIFITTLCSWWCSYPCFMVEETDTEQLCRLSRIFGYFLGEGVLWCQFLWPLRYKISLSRSSCFLWTPCWNKLCPRIYSKGSGTGFRIPVN